MLEAHGECGRLDFAQPSGLEQLCQVALAGAGEVRLTVDSGVERSCRVPEDSQGALTAAMIPDACGDDAVPAGHAAHLGQPLHRILHEVNDELCQGGVERGVRERQVLGWRSVHVDARMALPGRRNEWLGRIDGRHRRGSKARDQLARERAGAAADVENPLSAAYRRQVCQLAGEQARVSTHETVVRLGGHIEAHGLEYRLKQRPFAAAEPKLSKSGLKQSNMRAACARCTSTTAT